MKKAVIKYVLSVVLLFALIFVFYESIQKKEVREEISSQMIYDKEGNQIQYGPNKGDMLYDYKLKEVSTGKDYKISDFKDKKILLFFWASWCPYCKQAAPELQQMSEERDDIVVLGISTPGVESSKQDPPEFIEEMGLTFVNLTASEEMSNTFYIGSFPTFVFVNSDGIIEEGVVGGLTREVIEKRFETIE